MKLSWIKHLNYAAPNLSRFAINDNNFRENITTKLIQQISNALLHNPHGNKAAIIKAITSYPLDILKNKLQELETNFAQIQKKSYIPKLVISKNTTNPVRILDNSTSTWIKNLLPLFHIKGLRWVFTASIMLIICAASWIIYKVITHVLGTHHMILQWALKTNSNEVAMHMLASQDNLIFLCIGSMFSIIAPRTVKFLRKK